MATEMALAQLQSVHRCLSLHPKAPCLDRRLVKLRLVALQAEEMQPEQALVLGQVVRLEWVGPGPVTDYWD